MSVLYFSWDLCCQGRRNTLIYILFIDLISILSRSEPFIVPIINHPDPLLWYVEFGYDVVLFKVRYRDDVLTLSEDTRHDEPPIKPAEVLV